MDNCAVHRLAKVGAILVNVNPAYRLRELESHASDGPALSILIAARVASVTRIMSPNFSNLSGVGGARRWPATLLAPSALRAVVYLGPDRNPGGLAWPDLLECGDRVPHARLREQENDRLQFDDPINIQYTSGTTGSPKGATLSHHNILNNGFFVGEPLRYTAHDRVCIPVPFYHCFGCVMGNLGALTHGSAR